MFREADEGYIGDATNDVYNAKKTNNGRLPHKWMETKFAALAKTCPRLKITRHTINALERKKRAMAGELKKKARKAAAAGTGSARAASSTSASSSSARASTSAASSAGAFKQKHSLYDSSKDVLGKGWYHGFLHRNRGGLQAAKGRRFARNRAEHCTNRSFNRMDRTALYRPCMLDTTTPTPCAPPRHQTVHMHCVVSRAGGHGSFSTTPTPPTSRRSVQNQTAFFVLIVLQKGQYGPNHRNQYIATHPGLSGANRYHSCCWGWPLSPVIDAGMVVLRPFFGRKKCVRRFVSAKPR